MKRLLFAATLCAVSGAFASTGLAGPFGFDLNKSPEEYEFCSEFSTPHYYHCTTAPRPHPDMEFYRIKYIEDIGVCLVKSVGEDISDNGWGLDTKSATTAIAGQVTKKYGPWTESVDLLMPGAFWDEGNDWMMAIKQNERFFAYLWDLEKSPIEGIADVGVMAQTLSNDTGYVTVEFYSTADAQCDTKIEGDAADSF